MYVIVITFVVEPVDQLQSKLEQRTREIQPSALSIALDLSRVCVQSSSSSYTLNSIKSFPEADLRRKISGDDNRV